MTCKRCGGELKPSKAIDQTYTNGGGSSVSWWAAGPGKLIDCLKCIKCGWSITCAEPPVVTTTKPQ